jgi:hypothetical protein
MTNWKDLNIYKFTIANNAHAQVLLIHECVLNERMNSML